MAGRDGGEESRLAVKNGEESRLAPWARQGCLLLNTVLTVRRGEPRSHRGKGWEQFTDALLLAVLREQREAGAAAAAAASAAAPHPLVFMLWGRDAHDKAEALGIEGSGDDGVHVLRASHPSPLAATRPSGPAKPFTGSAHFARANEILVAADQAPIDWRTVG